VGNSNMAAIYSNGGNRWNILGFNFTKRDALSSVYKISMDFTKDGTRNFKSLRDIYIRYMFCCIMIF
jgi:opacity protein-like surface antigen